MDYTLRELMAIIAAREIKNGDIVFCGTGISMVAAMAAKHMNAPESIIFFETGAIDSALEEIPMAVADPRVSVLGRLQRGASRCLRHHAEPHHRREGHRDPGRRPD